MQQISATQAKQCFGELLDAAALGPVAIEKHGKIKAIVAAPDFFQATRAEDSHLAERRLARLGQALADKERTIRHQQIAVQLATLPAAEGRKLVHQARAVVNRWQAERLCSSDYIDRWHELLRMPLKELAVAMAAGTGDWGPALRQNSPWAEVALP